MRKIDNVAPASREPASREPAAHKVSTFRLEEILVPEERLRALNPETVEALVGSMKARGQLQNIIVRPGRAGGRHDLGIYTLVVGKHRYMAAKKLGWKKINAVIVSRKTTDAEAEMMEIDENLIRAELTAAERADHIGKRKKLYEALFPDTKAGKAPPKRSGKGGKLKSQNENLTSFVKDTAKKTGRGRSTVARDAARASKVVVLAEIKNTCLDNGKELDALAKLPERVQRELAARAMVGETVSAISLLGDPEASSEAQKATNKRLFGGEVANKKETGEKVVRAHDQVEETGEQVIRRTPDQVAEGQVAEESSAEQQTSAQRTAETEAAEKAAKSSAHYLSEFIAACDAYLPNITVEADREKAFHLVFKWIDPEAAEPMART
jgi:ParB family transcriptional regulator, chromosome partitioning protein